MTVESRREQVRARRAMVLSSQQRNRRRRRIPETRFPAGARATYAQLLRATLRDAKAGVDEQIVPKLGFWVDQVLRTRFDGLVFLEDGKPGDVVRIGMGDVYRTDAPRDDLTEIMAVLLKALQDSVTDEAAQTIALTVGRQAERFNRDEFARQMIAALGIDPIGAEPYLANAMADWATANVQLIKSIPEQYLSQVEQAVRRGFTQGRTNRELAKFLTERFQVAEKRAMLIATDQINKLNGQLTGLRQQSLGVTKYIWRTSQDERVRKTHRDRNGKEFRWSDPPPDGHPGEPIRCRCTAEPVVDPLLGL